jgi:hypothetical protein
MYIRKEFKMPRVGQLNVSVARDESCKTGKLGAALCVAIPQYGEIVLDKHEVRDGRSYQYASIASIRRAIMLPNCSEGITIQHCLDTNENGDILITTVRHGEEYISSRSSVPWNQDQLEWKRNVTLRCRVHLEGLLGIVVEDAHEEHAVRPSSEQPEEPAEFQTAKASLSHCPTRQAAANILDMAHKKNFPPAQIKALKDIANERFPAAKEASSDKSNGSSGVKAKNAGGSRGRRTADAVRG